MEEEDKQKERELYYNTIKTIIDEIDVVREEEGLIHIIGRNTFKKNSDDTETYNHIIVNAKNKQVMAEDEFKYLGSKKLESAKIASLLGVGLIPLAYQLTGDRPERREKSKDIKKRIKEYEKKNHYEITEAIKSISLYQTNIEETSKILRKELEVVDTGKQQKFLFSRDPDHLLMQAHMLGADALIMYSIVDLGHYGTPVKYKK